MNKDLKSRADAKRAEAQARYATLDNDEVDFANTLQELNIRPLAKVEINNPLKPRVQATFLDSDPNGRLAFKFKTVAKIFGIAVTTDPSKVYGPRKSGTNKPAKAKPQDRSRSNSKPRTSSKHSRSRSASVKSERSHRSGRSASKSSTRSFRSAGSGNRGRSSSLNFKLSPC